MDKLNVSQAIIKNPTPNVIPTGAEILKRVKDEQKRQMRVSINIIVLSAFIFIVYQVWRLKEDE